MSRPGRSMARARVGAKSKDRVGRVLNCRVIEPEGNAQGAGGRELVAAHKGWRRLPPLAATYENAIHVYSVSTRTLVRGMLLTHCAIAILFVT